MTFLIASQILSWIAIAVLGLLCLALARQVGVLHERIAPAGALSLASRISPGSPAPELSAFSLTNAPVAIGGVRGGRSQLLFFLSPDCPVCKALLPALKAAVKSEAAWLDVVLVSDGPGEAHGRFVRARGLEDFSYVVSEVVGRAFGVSKLPFGVLIDEEGRVAATGLINSREHLDSLFEAKDHRVPSIQAFIAQRNSEAA
ncbi:MAG TPA: redoxin domain-containing protein [Caulobacteraceae bacterium]|nr:redoxin domain-containing protein [Caulobacteraceae bacterium]